MRNVLLLALLLLSFAGYTQYPEGLTDITAGLAEGDDNFALTTEDDRSGTFKSTLVIIGDSMYFTATSTDYGDELYITDGTAEGTRLVKDINPGNADASPRYLVALNGKLYFQADDGTNGVELWESDGTSDGTIMVADIYSGAESSAPDMLTVLGDKIIFRATTIASSADAQKWIHLYDPALETASLVSEIQARIDGDAVIPRIQVDNKHNVAYFIGEPVGENQEVYKTDGTPAGTGKIFDVTPEILGSSNIQWLFVHDDSVLVWRQKTPRKYAGADSVNYLEHLSEQIWITDGTAGNTNMLIHMNKNVAGDGNGTNTQLAYPVSYNGKLYFRADNGVNGVELCESDLTEEGTFQIQDILPGDGSSWPEDYAVYKGYLCFDANGGDGNEGAEIRYLDPGDNTVKLMTYAIPGDGGTWGKRTTAFQYDGVDSLLYFVGNGPSTGGAELFVSSEIGSQAELVYELDPSGSTPHNLTSWKNALYFTSNKVNRLFRYNFTVAPKLIAEGSVFYDYSNMQDTTKVIISKLNGEALANKVVKIEPDDNSKILMISKTKEGPFGFDAIYTANTDVDSFYVVANHSVLDPDGFKWSANLRAINLNTDTLYIGGRVILEPVFRHELVYHVDLGNVTDAVTNSMDITGTHNSVFDQIYGLDTVAGKTWGYIASGWGWEGAGNKWNTMRERNYQEDSTGLKYKLEIEPGDYVVQVGWYENWGTRSQEIYANGDLVVPETASLPSDYLVIDFEVNIPESTDSLLLVFKSVNSNNAYVSWFKVGVKCTEANCDTLCFDPICDLRSELYNPDDIGTSIDQNLAENHVLKVYPNPARETISVEADPEVYSSISILDLTGKMVINAPVTGSVTKLNAGDLNAGVYIVKAQGDHESAITKIVISK
jgi:ELWxxDGT repeat protein